MPVIDDKQKILDKENSKVLQINNGQITFENVDFNYKINEQQILNSVNLNIPGQKMTALVGHSGAGKSTILNLIPRFYDPHKGNIKIDNQSIYELKFIL